MIKKRGDIGLLACKSGRHFAKKIEDYLQKKDPSARILKSEEKMFPNKEIRPRILESIQDKDIYIIQDYENLTDNYSTNDNLMALMLMINAARLADAYHITVVVPSFPYARQDKQDKRDSISAAVVAQMIDMLGVEKIVTLDLHNTATQGNFRVAKPKNLYSSGTFVPYIRSNPDLFDLKNTVIGAPDAGSLKRSRVYAKNLNLKRVFLDKNRDDQADIDDAELHADDIKDKDVIFIDDMIATAGTAITAAKLAKDKGARKVYLFASLPLFNKPAFDKFDKAHKDGLVDLVISTDAVYHGGEEFWKNHPWFVEVPISDYFAEAILTLNTRGSLSDLYEDRSKGMKGEEN